MAILRMTDVKRERGHKSHASVYAEVHNGFMTSAVKTGQRAVGWPECEVKAINIARTAGASEKQLRDLVDKLHAKRQSDFEELCAS